MKLFLKKLLFYLVIPFLILFSLEGLLPITTFTHRHFEAVLFKTNIPHQTNYYPNINSSMNAVGDLCHHTKNAILKKEIWKTDKFGFRNNEFIENPDILIIGDSFTQGSSLSQEETISNRVKLKSKNRINVYNMAPSSVSEFDKYLKLGLIKKPKLLIISIVERNIHPEIIYYNTKKNSIIDNELDNIFGTFNINVFLDKAIKLNSIEWIKARLQNSKGMGVPSIGNSNMYFLKGINQGILKSDIETSVQNILSYRKYCDSLGVKFLFLPMPNKETVYFERVPLPKQPNYLLELDSILVSKKVSTINTLKIYNLYNKSKNKKLLYHLDDTHWNANATNLISTEIVTKYIALIKK